MTAKSSPKLPPSAGLALRLGLGLWVAVAVAVGVRTCLRPDSHTVFPIFAAGARHWWADQPLYERDAVLDDFRYPPAFAVAVSPLAVLGPRAGGTLWVWLSMTVLFAGAWRLARDVLPGEWPPQRTALLLALVSLGALRGLWNAQSNALVVGLLLLGAAALARERWWRASFWLSAAVWVKLTPLAVALLFCALWPRRLTPRLLVALAVVPLLPFLTRPPAVVWNHYAEWLSHLGGTSGERWPGFRDGWTVWVVLRHMAEGNIGPVPLREPITGVAYRVPQLLGALGALGWCLWQKRRGAAGPQLVLLTTAIGCAWLMLFGPAVEHPTYVFLAPFVAWGFLDRDAWPGGRRLILAAFGLVMVLGWGGLTRPVAEAFPLVLVALPVGTALFAVWLAGYARHQAVAVPEPSVLAMPERRRLAASGLQLGGEVGVDELPGPLTLRRGGRGVLVDKVHEPVVAAVQDVEASDALASPGHRGLEFFDRFRRNPVVLGGEDAQDGGAERPQARRVGAQPAIAGNDGAQPSVGDGGVQGVAAAGA
jgi:hypothetical protein